MKITFLVSGSIKSNFSYRPLALAKSLHKLGHDVTIIAPTADKYNDFIPEHIENIDGVRILQPFQFTTRQPLFNFLPYVFDAAKILLRQHSDLVYIYKPTPVSVVGLVAKLFRGTQTVADFDDLGSEVMRVEGHPAYQRMGVRWSEKLAAKYTDKLVVASLYLFNMYRGQFSAKPMLIVPNAAEANWFEPIIPSTHPRRIVFIGSINRKNILEPLFDVLPDIVRTYPDVNVLIIGSGKFLPYFKEKVTTLHIENNVTFTGWLPLDQARSHLHAEDIGYSYMPDEMTIQAASNMKVPQYMARGVVPLVSDVGDLKATADNGKAGYISKADDRESLQNALLNALTDPDKRKKSEHGRTFAMEHLHWDKLAQHFDQWIDPKHHSKNKKIYIVATSVPGDVGGGEIRNYDLLKQLIKHVSPDVHVFCISPTDTEQARRKLESAVPVVCHIVSEHPRTFASMTRAVLQDRVPPYMDDFKSSGLGDMLRAACEEALPDIVHIEQLHSYYCIRPHIAWLKQKGVRIVFDCHNVEYMNFKDSLHIFPFSKKLTGRYITPHLKTLEIEATQLSDIVLACSEHDASFFKMYNRHTHIIPNGVDCSVFDMTTGTDKHIIVFMGNIGYPPNADAMQWYVQEIHPKVQAQIPDIQLLAIGTKQTWLDELGIYDHSIKTSIKALGFVDDVRPYLHQAALGICPVRYGSGTRIKILTYMAVGLPVVSTHKGAEGVGYTDRENIRMTDDPASFAEAIVELMRDKEYRNALRTRGHEFVTKHYDWNTIGKRLANIYLSDLHD